jgi:carbonic anhydrase
MRFLVIVVGHTRCGGAAACLESASSGSVTSPSTPLERWLVPLTRLAKSLNLGGKPSDAALNVLVEENVKAQVHTLAKSEPVLSAWKDPAKRLYIHGWVYDLEKGTLKDLEISQGPA